MKAISVKQPWANMIRDTVKTIEVRTWRTTYRGPLLIVSSKRPAIEPAGQAIALVSIYDCRKMEPDDDIYTGGIMFDPSMYSWMLHNIMRIDPFPVTGKLGIYEVELTPAQAREIGGTEDGPDTENTS